jgi:hypothetical protein
MAGGAVIGGLAGAAGGATQQDRIVVYFSR